MSSVTKLHKESAPKSVGVYIITCSTSKFKQIQANETPSDESGDIIEELARDSGNVVVGRTLISDSVPMIRKTTRKALAESRVDVVIITGGTGFSTTDATYEAIEPTLDREIPGFGELFRKISFDEIGSAAMLSRAFAGIVGQRAIFCLPGSPNAVRTAMQRLILPELGHLVGLARGH
ncbi:MAG TPA: molybdenum cofactor biosynthesis protein B [Terriglobales bacterium]|nr:molybdenum cofactor biosynthesis protein B [Terriglobales bacterium]